MYIVYIHSILYHTIFLAKILQEISKICYHTVMKTLKTPILSDTTKELASFFEAPQDILFFDIETTGFSARSACVYLIGCAYLTTNGWETRQFFAETPDDEADVLQQFFPFPPPFRSWYILTEQPSMFRFCRPARKNSGFLLSRRPSSTTSTKK